MRNNRVRERYSESTSRLCKSNIHGKNDLGITSSRYFLLIPTSPLVDYFPDIRPNKHYNCSRDKVRFNEEMETRNDTNRNGIGPGVNTGNVTERRYRRPRV